MKRYQVIGGQYESKWIGESDSLHGAKVIAGSNKEYWDNWQDWVTPRIYSSDDVIEIVSSGRITSPDGSVIRIPLENAMSL